MNLALRAIRSTASIQGQFWSAGAADWSMLQEPLHGPLWHAMPEPAGVKRGTRFLDAGCGAGATCVALHELTRVAKSGGKIAGAIWGKPEDCDMSAVFAAVYAATPNPPARGGPADLSGSGALETALTKAGCWRAAAGDSFDGRFI
jgi:hypothetical protein